MMTGVPSGTSIVTGNQPAHRAEIIMTETTTETLASLKEVREYFGLDGKAMVNQWRKLDENAKRDLRAGLANKTLTY